MTQIHKPNMKVGLLHMNATRVSIKAVPCRPPSFKKIPVEGLMGVCAPKKIKGVYVFFLYLYFNGVKNKKFGMGYKTRRGRPR